MHAEQLAIVMKSAEYVSNALNDFMYFIFDINWLRYD